MYTANAAGCTTALTGNATGGTRSNNPLTGIIGFESGTTTVYVVNDQGKVFSWTPGSQPAFKAARSSNYAYRDIHGGSASLLLLAADDASGGGSTQPTLHSYNAPADVLAAQTTSAVPVANEGNLYGIWAWDSTHAYAVGNKGVLLKWNGATNWSFASPKASMQTNLTSVVALDDASVYVADVGGNIRRPGASDWVVHFTASGALNDLAAVGRDDIWAVGNGIVVHFE
jgi:photosystem II stability/assembly factor-like uncharacterized protein